ncbi:Ig-like domain-containing protein [Leptospira kanakyensis]|uniref:Ig-like domain-containing protein n=1 Tax=Leptospira kanakyensis TaxID=2484968 RepID=UPI003CCFF035
MTSSPTTFSFTFSETLDIDASNASTWIATNIIQTQSIIQFNTSTVNISNNRFDLNISSPVGTGNTYTTTFGSGIKVKSGKPMAPGTKVTFTCISGCAAL